MGKFDYTFTYTLLIKKGKQIIFQDDKVQGKTQEEVLSKAEALVVKRLQQKDAQVTKDLEIILQPLNNKTLRKMKWHPHPLVDGTGTGYFEDWDFYESIEAEEPNTVKPKWRNTWGIPLVLTVIILGLAITSVIFTLNESLTGTVYMTVSLLLAGLSYSSVVSVVRSNFGDKASGLGYIICYNILLEIPVWITTGASTFALLMKASDAKDVDLNGAGIISAVVVFLVVKISLSIILDYEKLTKKKRKIKK